MVSCGAVFETETKCTYSITGTAGTVSVTYKNEQGGTSQADVSLPWTYSYTGKFDTFFYCSGQIDSNGGSITITYSQGNGQSKTAQASGAFNIASVSGSVTK